MVGAPRAPRDGGPRPGAQGALLRPGLLPDGSRVAVAAGLADGVPARGDPGAARLRRVRDPRPVGHRGAHRRHGCARVPERVPPPRREGRRGAGHAASAASPARSTAGATASTATNTFVSQRKTFAEHNLRARRHRPRARALRDVGRLRVDQPRRRRAAAAGVHRAVRHDPRRVEGRVAAHRVVVRVPAPGELEARRGGVRRAVPRRGDASAARHLRAATRPAPAPRSTRARSSTPTSTTCAR